MYDVSKWHIPHAKIKATDNPGIYVMVYDQLAKCPLHRAHPGRADIRIHYYDTIVTEHKDTELWRTVCNFVGNMLVDMTDFPAIQKDPQHITFVCPDYKEFCTCQNIINDNVYRLLRGYINKYPYLETILRPPTLAAGGVGCELSIKDILLFD